RPCRTRSWLISSQRSRAGLKYSAAAELKCGKWDIARKVESDGPRERGARSGSKQERLGGAAGMGCGKTRESRFPSTPRKSPHPFAKNAKEWSTRAKADSE